MPIPRDGFAGSLDGLRAKSPKISNEISVCQFGTALALTQADLRCVRFWG
jgi:hypothetical protein